MDKRDIEKMQAALETIYEICTREQKKNKKYNCRNCPANKIGRLCHSGAISCCAPHRWRDYK